MADQNSSTTQRRIKIVPVVAYVRHRFGKPENVRKHLRSLPYTAANDDRYDGGQ